MGKGTGESDGRSPLHLPGSEDPERRAMLERLAAGRRRRLRDGFHLSEEEIAASTRAAMRLAGAEPRELALPDLPAPAGLSTGWDPAHRGDFPAAVAHAAQYGTGTVELSALSTHDLPALVAYLHSSRAPQDLAGFEHFSVHAPAKHLPDDWTVMVGALSALPLTVQSMVMHPDTFRVQDLALLARLGDRLVVENMDCRKDDCRTAAQMQRIFQALPQARFCLDVAHVLTVDPTLEEGHRLLDAYGDRLVEVHVSGIRADGTHRLTTAQDLAVYRPLLDRCAGVPWVFEAPYVG